MATWMGSDRVHYHRAGPAHGLYSLKTVCPFCEAIATTMFFEAAVNEVVAIKHFAIDLDKSCPAVDHSDLDPRNIGQGLIPEYKLLASQMFEARRAVEVDERREARMFNDNLSPATKALLLENELLQLGLVNALPTQGIS